MNPLNSHKSGLKRITFTELLESLSAGAQASLRKISKNPEVTYFIVLQPPSMNKKKVISAGPNLDFRTPKDLIGTIVGGMKATMYVDLTEKTTEPAPAPAPAIPSTRMGMNNGQIKALEAKVEWLKNENFLLTEKVAHAKAQIITRNQLVDEYSKVQAILKARVQELTSSTDTNINDVRLNDINKAEEELITRMNEYMEKEAELEQREENLFYRERMLHEKEPVNQESSHLTAIR